MAVKTPGLDLPCPRCRVTVGDHTLRGWGECCEASGLNYSIGFEDVPCGPIMFDGVDGAMSSEVNVLSAFIDSPIGRLPLLRFQFIAPGATPMSKIPLPPINLVMDPPGLKGFAALVATAVDRALIGARDGR